MKIMVLLIETTTKIIKNENINKNVKKKFY